MNIRKTLDEIRRKHRIRQDGMDDEGWKTIKGTHVLIDEGGEMSRGPERLRGWNTARREKARQAAVPKEKRAGDCTTGKELINHIASKKITMTRDFETLLESPNHFESVQKILKGYEDVLEEIPELKDVATYFDTCTSGVLSSSGKGVNFNPKYTKSLADMEELCRTQSARHQWPPNTTPAGLIAHELGHCVEWAIILKNYAIGRESNNAWAKCTVATQIVGEAVKKIKRTEFGKGKKMAELVESISKYATKDKSEALAEAMADCYDNGENANPLSKAIKEEALRRLRA